MQTVLWIILIALLAAVTALLVYLISSLAATRRDLAGQGANVDNLNGKLEALRTSQETLGQSLNQNLQSGQQNLTTFLTGSSKTLGDLKQQLGNIEGHSRQMVQVSADLRSLQNILQAPKLRGLMGEYSLENLLKAILPIDHYELQHGFRSGKKIDALIKLADYAVPIDAKFPLESFQKMAEAQADDERAKLRKQFLNDVTKHIDKIADSYILPNEGTLDFALMYIPAENVYYETIVRQAEDKTDLSEYARGRKVIAVSPNLLYAYLMTVVMGLHGMAIEKQAEIIRANLGRLSGDWNVFLSDWQTLGSHLRNAANKYDDSQKKLDRFSLQLEQIQKTESISIAPEE
jgi:DNA recombination protein RmuC